MIGPFLVVGGKFSTLIFVPRCLSTCGTIGRLSSDMVLEGAGAGSCTGASESLFAESGMSGEDDRSSRPPISISWQVGCEAGCELGFESVPSKRGSGSDNDDSSSLGGTGLAFFRVCFLRGPSLSECKGVDALRLLDPEGGDPMPVTRSRGRRSLIPGSDGADV